jgi:hypothetical protein
MLGDGEVESFGAMLGDNGVAGVGVGTRLGDIAGVGAILLGDSVPPVQRMAT